MRLLTESLLCECVCVRLHLLEEKAVREAEQSLLFPVFLVLDLASQHGLQVPARGGV